jgi:hypothetical protein
MMLMMIVIDIGELFIGREEREGNVGSGVAAEDDNDANAEEGEYAHNFLEVALSQLWEGRFGRRTKKAKTMETSRDDEHEEDVVPRLMFETLCEGVRREMCCGHHCCRLPPAAARRRGLPRVVVVVVVVVQRRFHAGRGGDDGDIGTGDTFVTTTTTTTYNDETCTIR